jgi:hypothetical protein
LPSHQREDVINEANYKQRLIKAINLLPGAYGRRIEDRYSVGVLDMIIKLPNMPIVFAEAKWLSHGWKFGPSGRQFHEGNHLIGAGLKAILIGWKDGQMYLSPWVEFADVRECFRRVDCSEVGAIREFISDPR